MKIPDISICMVSLNCWNVLKDCMRSLDGALGGLGSEVVVVDNNSSDGTARTIGERFPDIKLIINSKNVGFTVATNQAIKESRGKYILWLNTDTVLYPNSLKSLYEFMEDHPHVGIVGPKVLNEDGSFQPQCKRGLPTPLSSLAHMLKLNKIAPNNRFFGNYFLAHLPIDEDNQVVSVSGCCLFARRDVWDDIGPLDENIIGFGEDIDWCMRAKKAGWEVWYYPRSVITHLKGQGGTHARPYCKIWGMHQAMWMIYKKYFSRWYNFILTAAVFVGISLSFAISCIKLCIQRAASFLPW